jgi:hypothetical protein
LTLLSHVKLTLEALRRCVPTHKQTHKHLLFLLATNMRLSTVFSAFVVVATGITGVTAANFTADSITTAASLSPQNYYGAPIPPWGAGGHPGWYYGKGNAPIGVFSILDTACSL